MYNKQIIILRIVAVIFFLFRSIGWLVYPYLIDKSYSLYSFFMMFSYLIGASFSKSLYQSKFGLIAIGVYILAILFTGYHAVYEAMDGSKSALQSMSIRIFEIILLLSLTIVAFYFRRNQENTEP